MAATPRVRPGPEDAPAPSPPLDARPVRHTAVLRAPPAKPPPGAKRTGRVGDTVAGALGIVLLLVCVWLVAVLPHKDHLAPQFNVDVPTTELFPPAAEESQPSHTAYYMVGAANATRVYHFDIPNDDITSVTVTTYFEDDLPASLPDIFSYELTDHTGNVRGKATMIANPPPSIAPSDLEHTLNNPSEPIPVTSQAASSRIAFPITPAPQPDVYQAPNATTTAEQVAQTLERTYHQDTHGVWTLTVHLLSAGGCPDSGSATDTAEAQLRAACMQQEAGSDPAACAPTPPATSSRCAGADAGNLLNFNLGYNVVALVVTPITDDGSAAA